ATRARRERGPGDAGAGGRGAGVGGDGPRGPPAAGRVAGRGGLMVLCWTEAGADVGFGHLSRVIALLEALEERREACRVALPADPTALAWLRMAGARSPILLPVTGPPLPHVLDAASEARAVVIDV